MSRSLSVSMSSWHASARRSGIVCSRKAKGLCSMLAISASIVRRIVTARGSEVKLSPREYEVLRLMAAHAGKVMTHRLMLREIWGGDADVQYLRIYIRALRQKIEADPERPTHILPETGGGYRLREPDQ